MKNIENNSSQNICLLLFSLTAMILLGCASPKMADISASSEPKSEIAKLDSELNIAVTKNIDILERPDFKKSQNYLNKAQADLKNGKSQNEVLDSVRIGKQFLNEAYSKAGDRESQAPGLFDARQMALRAGAASIVELQDDLSTVDSKVSDIAENLSKTKVEKLSVFQNQYIDLERRAVISSQLGQTQAILNGAKSENAQKMAPVSLKAAELSLKTAESIISTNVRNADGFRAAVLTAKQDVNQLANVMTTISQNGKNLSETAAVKMVAQNKVIAGLEKNAVEVAAKGQVEKNALQLENQKTNSAMQSENIKLAQDNDSKNAELNSKDVELYRANQKVQIQRALEKARSQFSTSEAEAYQKGDNLVIRLKQINFASGKSDLPANSLPLLAKVLTIAKTLNTSQIVVEGHTDSIGSEQSNMAISENRASAVATYLKSNGLAAIKIESEGYGFAKPIADNKSKEGRAQNRRVDVILSPSDKN